jgi:hypothetical protein
MPQSTLAGIVSAFGILGLLLTGFAALITALATRRTSLRTEHKVDEVHTMVNQQRTDAQNYQRALIKALQAAGVAVPDDQSAADIERD